MSVVRSALDSLTPHLLVLPMSASPSSSPTSRSHSEIGSTFDGIQTSRIYGMILGNRACCVAVQPNPGWEPLGVNGWRVVSTVGLQGTVMLLER